MKRKLFLTFLLAVGLSGVRAQDDVYFVPSETAKEAAEAPAFESTYENVFAEGEDNWAEGRGNNGWDVDEYNRRGAWRDSLAADTAAYADEAGEEAAGYSCTGRLVRFHAPTVGVLVSSPYYYAYYDDLCWYDPWYYDAYFGWGWYGWGWRPYYWSAWWGGWYDPWWGWGPGWGPAWGHHHHHWAHIPGAIGGPRGGFVRYAGRGSATERPSNRYLAGGRSTGGTLNRYRPSSRYGNTGSLLNRGNASRNWGVQRPSTGSNRPSRGNINTRPSSGYTPSRSFGSPSGGNVSRPTSRPSGGGFTGGARGGGRSFGGRR